MIFNEANVMQENVAESPYKLGIGGALMHVYENECNYNAIMKAAALSEMKYYNECGGDLFLQEAGAFSSLVDKFKKFFKTVIEKIKSIFAKFVAKINQFAMSDKDFLKKYRSEIRKKNLTDFEFNGYNFEKRLNDTLKDKKINSIEFVDTGSTWDDKNNTNAETYQSKTEDQITDKIETNRGNLIGKGKLTESEFRDELQEMLYGDKEDLEIGKNGIEAYFKRIEDTKQSIKDVDAKKKEVIRAIENMIKLIDKLTDKVAASKNDEVGYANNNSRQNRIKALTAANKINRAAANDMTVYFGALSKAFTDANRQAKAICVKALSYNYKNESAVAEGASYGDIFAGVEIM